MVQKFTPTAIERFSEFQTLIRRPAIAASLCMPLGQSSQLDNPAAERIQRFLGSISAFSHLAGRRSRRKLSANPGRPYAILTPQDGSYIFVTEVKA